MDLHSITCPHGQGIWHLIIDLWWAIALFSTGPIYYIKNKLYKKNNGK